MNEWTQLMLSLQIIIPDLKPGRLAANGSPWKPRFTGFLCKKGGSKAHNPSYNYQVHFGCMDCTITTLYVKPVSH